MHTPVPIVGDFPMQKFTFVQPLRETIFKLTEDLSLTGKMT